MIEEYPYVNFDYMKGKSIFFAYFAGWIINVTLFANNLREIKKRPEWVTHEKAILLEELKSEMKYQNGCLGNL